MAEEKTRTWGEFLFGTEADRKRAKEVLKEIRPDGRYTLPKLGSVPVGDSGVMKSTNTYAPKGNKVESTKDVEERSKSMSNPTQRAYDKRNPNYVASGVAVPPNPPVPKAKPNKPAAPKAAGDKSRVAKKMTNFERMKQRQYEKEGVGGRSVTAEGARKRVMEERKYKPLAGLKSASLKSSSSGNSNRSKLAAAFKKKLQGRAK
jgi:hypothetical protein